MIFPRNETKKVNGLPVIQSDVELTRMNTMGVPAVAGTFIDIRNSNELKALFKRNFFDTHDPFILGGGSNILFLDHPDRPVLKVSITGITTEFQDDDSVLICAGAGENWHQLVAFAVEKGFGGIENLALIPGTTGAAPIQNIGAYGVELKDRFFSLKVFNVKTGQFLTFGPEDCKFGYRDSVFKHDLKGKMIITELTLRLTTQNHKLNTEYSGLSGYLEKNGISEPGIKNIFESVVAIRTSKLPDPDDIGNAGSFFKNPIVNVAKYRDLKDQFPGMPFYKMDDGEYKIPAAWFIEQAGWKGKRVGNVGSYKNQALVIVNHGGATGREVYNYAKKIQKSVQKHFGVDLKPEVNMIGLEN